LALLGRIEDRQSQREGQRLVRPNPLSFKRHALDAHDAPIANADFWRPIAVEIADLGVGDPGVLLLVGREVLRIVEHMLEFLVEEMDLL